MWGGKERGKGEGRRREGKEGEGRGGERMGGEKERGRSSPQCYRRVDATDHRSSFHNFCCFLSLARRVIFAEGERETCPGH